MRSCESCGREIHGRRKVFCDDCKRARHALGEKARRDAARERNSGEQDESPAAEARTEPVDFMDQGVIPGQRYQFRTQYAPGPAVAERETVDYTQGGHDAPGLGPRPSLTGIPNRVRQDHRALQVELHRREFGATDDVSPGDIPWADMLTLNLRAGDDRMVSFDRTPWTEPRVNYLGQSTRRPRSWR